MILETTLNTVLAAATSKNVYKLERKQGDLDCVVFKRISTKPFHTLSAKSTLERGRYQVECYGLSDSACASIAEDVVSALDSNTTDFKGCILLDDFPVKQIDEGLYWRVLDFYIWA